MFSIFQYEDEHRKKDDGGNLIVDIEFLFCQLWRIKCLYLADWYITIKGSQWECIWFLWKDISSNHNLRWIPRIHLVLHPFIETSAKSENQKKKMLCWCVLVCYAQWAECLLLHEWYQDNRQRWMGKYTFRILKIQFAEQLNICCIVAQWEKCLILQDWYQDNRPELNRGNAFWSSE